MALYDQLFRKHDMNVAQVLLTHEDLRNHDRHLNARNTITALLAQQTIPIINENDAVSTTELKFGDNDRLSALVTCLLPADLLVMLTTVDGVIEDFGGKNPRTLETVTAVNENIRDLARGTLSEVSVGGMETKIEAATMTARSGIPMVIADGNKANVVARILKGDTEGTLFVPRPGKLRGRKRWIAFFHHPRGSVTLDDGAVKALSERGKSLLPPGITECAGEFKAGEVVSICDPEGREFARGIAAFDGEQIRDGGLKRVEVVHRDDLVIL
jgi:glutamate 5-kinase